MNDNAHGHKMVIEMTDIRNWCRRKKPTLNRQGCDLSNDVGRLDKLVINWSLSHSIYGGGGPLEDT